MTINKEKIYNLFQKEMSMKIYIKNNVINSCYKCNICNEYFINNSSLIITTKCNHTFHAKCIKNYIYTNIICPKCPIYNYPFLDFESKRILQKINAPFLFITETEDNINK